MKNNSFYLLMTILVVLAFSCSPKEKASAQNQTRQDLSVHSADMSLPFEKGETLTYAIKNLGIKAGDATLTLEGVTERNAREVNLIIFRAQAVNFLDEERIYADPETFYPLVVKRNLNIWGKKEKIEEYYNFDKGHIKIIKTEGGKTSEQIIEKKGKIDNIYCFIYRYRRSGDFNIGDSLGIRLPTKDITIELTKKTSLKAAGKKYDAFFMRSIPKKYQVWFDTGAQKIPLRINGSIGLSATAMTMTGYKKSG